MRDRLLGLTGLLVIVISVVWAVAADPGTAVAILGILGLILVAMDALIWRNNEPGLPAPEGVVLPSAPWGVLAGPAGALGLVTAVVAGEVALGIASGLALAAALPGLVRRFPAGAVPLRTASYARRVRGFAEAHGAERGASVTGYSAPVGEGGTRLVVIAPDGAWADVVVPVDEAGTIASLAKVDLAAPTDSSAARRLRIAAPFWESMTRSW